MGRNTQAYNEDVQDADYARTVNKWPRVKASTHPIRYSHNGLVRLLSIQQKCRPEESVVRTTKEDLMQW